MVHTRSLGELMEDEILQYYKMVLHINDRAFIHTEIYIYTMLVSVTLGFMVNAFVRQSDEILQYYKMVLHINDRAFIHTEIYIYTMLVSVTLGFMVNAFVRQSDEFVKYETQGHRN